MKISLYTGVKNGLFYDFHVEAMLRHHVPFVDEIVVNEGYSTDGTFEAISQIDPKIRVHRFEWDRSDPNAWHRQFKNQARELCTGDWCILLDCDEFIPEWEFPRLRQTLASTDKSIVPVTFTHFYGSYLVYMAHLPKIVPGEGLRIHRNVPEIEVWGDGANVHWRGRENDASLVATTESFGVHHFGSVRHAARLRQKWRVQAKQHDAKKPKWDKVPGFVFDLFPHQWEDPDVLPDLAIYDGPHMKIVTDNPGEFTRDGFETFEVLDGAVPHQSCRSSVNPVVIR